MRVRVFLRLVIATTPCLAACAAMLGIEELPVAARDAGLDAPLETALDACDAPEAGFCARTCAAYDFCDDFENEGTDFYRWQHPPAVPVPLRSPPGAFLSSVDVLAGAPGRGNVLSVRAESKSNVPTAIWLVDVLPKPAAGKTPIGVAMRVKAQLGELTFPDDPPGLAERADLFGLGLTGGLAVPVVVFSVFSESADVAIALRQETIPGGGPSYELTRVERVPRIALQAFVEVELAVGPRPRLVAEKYPCAPDLDAGGLDADADAAAAADAGGAEAMMVAIRSFGLARCVLLTDELAAKEWVQQALLIVGANVKDYGTTRWTFDDVAARFLY